MKVARRFMTAAGLGALLTATVFPQLEGQEDPLDTSSPEWRTWTDASGSQLEAFLRTAHPTHVLLEDRRGYRYGASLERLSERDQQYIAEWARTNLPSPADFHSDTWTGIAYPDRYEIANVEHRRPGAGEPVEPAAIKMVLDYHGIPWDEGLSTRITVREIYRDRFIPPRDLVNALRNLPVEPEVIASWDPYADDHEENWADALGIIRAAISMDLPVIIGYRPDMEIDTLELVGVATGYDRRNLYIIEPTGSRQSTRFHVRGFEFQFAYAMILFPTLAPPLPPVEAITIEATFLNQVSATIRDHLAHDPQILAQALAERGIQTAILDVNRSDHRDSLGQTRSFARRGGLSSIDLALNNARVVVVPQEFEQGNGFALIYGRMDESFAVVNFFPDLTFDRTVVSRPDLARRWLYREDRTYRLDLIEVSTPHRHGHLEPPPARRPLADIPFDPEAPEARDPAPPDPPTPPDPPDPPTPPDPEPPGLY